MMMAFCTEVRIQEPEGMDFAVNQRKPYCERVLSFTLCREGGAKGMWVLERETDFFFIDWRERMLRWGSKDLGFVALFLNVIFFLSVCICDKQTDVHQNHNHDFILHSFFFILSTALFLSPRVAQIFSCAITHTCCPHWSTHNMGIPCIKRGYFRLLNEGIFVF